MYRTMFCRKLLKQDCRFGVLPHLRRFSAAHPFASLEVRDDVVSMPALRARYHFPWLRDSCQCPRCVHPSTRQKLHRSSDIPSTIRPLEVSMSDKGLKVIWPTEEQSGTHESLYLPSFLEDHSSRERLFDFHLDVMPAPWKAGRFAAMSREGLSIPYAALSEPSTLLLALKQLVSEGLVFFRDMPTAATSNESCELRVLASRFGELRRTFYGETWDVMNVQNSKNIAYTNLDLGFHMDLLCVAVLDVDMLLPSP